MNHQTRESKIKIGRADSAMLFVLFSLIFPVMALADWQAPTVAPTGGNTLLPINVGAASQTKSGALTILQNFQVGGLTTLLGTLGVGPFGSGDWFNTASPADVLDVNGTTSAKDFCLRDPSTGLTKTGNCLSNILGSSGTSGSPSVSGVTSLSQGSGITLSPNPITGGTGSISANTTLVDCTSGYSAIASIAGNGTPTCVSIPISASGGISNITSADGSINVTTSGQSRGLAVNTTKFQSRISGSCSGGGINHINTDGTVSCTTAAAPCTITNNVSGNAGSGGTITCAGATMTVPATTYTLTVSKGSSTGSGTITSNPAGINCGATCSVSFNYNTSVTLTATADAGSTFTGWSGGGCSGTGTCTVTMNQAQSVTATFAVNFSIAIDRGVILIGGSNTIDNSDSNPYTGQITSSPAGINCGATCSATYNGGTSAILTATPHIGSTFTAWQNGFGTCPGTGTCTMPASGSPGGGTVTALFTARTYTLSVSKGNSTGSGTVTSVSSAYYPGYSNGEINCGSTCSVLDYYGESVTLTAVASSGSTFTGWSGGGCSGTGTCTVTMNQAQSVTATFAPQTMVTLTVGNYASGYGTLGNGTVTSGSSVSPQLNCGNGGTVCSGSVGQGTSVTLTATPAGDGSVFPSPYLVSVNGGSWSGACAGVSASSCTFTIQSSQTVKAGFDGPMLTVSKAGTGTGTVISSSSNGYPGINCGSVCNGSTPPGTVVTLTATAASGSTFTGWSGGGCSGTGTCTVTMNSSQNVTANFNVQYTLNVTPQGISCGTSCTNGTGRGAVVNTVPSSVIINCDNSGSNNLCSASVNSGTSVTLNETSIVNSSVGSFFTGWSGVTCGEGSQYGATCTVVMTAARSVTATFESSPLLSVSLSGGANNGTGVVSSSDPGIISQQINCYSGGGGICGAWFYPNTTIKITESPTNGSTFSGWSGNCTGTANYCNFNSGTTGLNISATANFAGSTVGYYTLAVHRETDVPVTGTAANNLAEVIITDTSNNNVLFDCPYGMFATGCGGLIKPGTTVKLHVNPAPSNYFSFWLGDCGNKTTGDCYLTMNINHDTTAEIDYR